MIAEYMKYDFLLFDADDTLLDFKRAEREALSEALKRFGISPTEELIASYSEINDSLWKLLETGGIEKNELRTKRFELFLRKHGFEADHLQMAAEYTDRLAEKSYLMPGALEICRYFYGKCRIFVITNGIKAVQTGRMNVSPIKRFIERSYISEEVGAEKPSRDFFDRVMNDIEGFECDRALVIGDSLSSDIAGGMAAGIDTCWLNPHSKKCPDIIKPTYEIKCLDELRNIPEDDE